ncbi:MAG TPA: HlyD family secretion protein [Tepidisphaeraceae bacterium]|jgi:membrane fusion protein (multidrug efflux system)
MSQSHTGNGEITAQQATMTAPDPQPEAFARVTPEPPPAQPRKSLFKRPAVLIVLLLLLIAGTAFGVIWWLDARQFETTDDAFIQADATRVSPRVSGHVRAVHINDNQTLNAGDVIADLDPRDLQAKAAEAQASVAAAEAGLVQATESAASSRANVGQARAAEEASRTEADRAHNELNRFQQLSAQAVTQQQLINYKAAATSADANLAAALQKTIFAQANAKAADAQISLANAQIQQAQATLNAANLQLSYTSIKAPISGHVTNKSIQPGDYVQVGQALLALVPHDVYVIANFKETQLGHIQPGQEVDITLDAYPGRTFHGKVDSIQRGSGAAFSLLPPENATGNYVKVVQRVPVKITFQVPDDVAVGPGMSAVPEVKVR